ncbi:MAG: hypothetical protein AAF573_01880, partial [Bacteroidota bacterium]
MRIRFFVFFLSLAFCVAAQEQYSYITERIFDDQTDLIGYNFRPYKMDVPGNYEPIKIAPGSYSFGVTRGRLYVNGDNEIAGVYEISNMEATRYGYIVNLIDPRNPASWGHLKVVINKFAEAEAIVFKKASKAAEIIFHLPDANEEQLKYEQNFYTDLGEVQINELDSLWGKKFIPYFKIESKSRIQNRLYKSDSTSITFEEIIKIKEKKPKKKKVKKDKSEKKKKRRRRGKKKEEEKSSEEQQEEESEEEEEEEYYEEYDEEYYEEDEEYYEDEEEATQPAVEEPKEEQPKKISKSYFIVVKTKLYFDNGKTEYKVWEFPVKKMEERTDEFAKKGEEKYQIAV